MFATVHAQKYKLRQEEKIKEHLSSKPAAPLARILFAYQLLETCVHAKYKFAEAGVVFYAFVWFSTCSEVQITSGREQLRALESKPAAPLVHNLFAYQFVEYLSTHKIQNY